MDKIRIFHTSPDTIAGRWVSEVAYHRLANFLQLSFGIKWLFGVVASLLYYLFMAPIA
jgi:hypothetical protein